LIKQLTWELQWKNGTGQQPRANIITEKIWTEEISNKNTHQQHVLGQISNSFNTEASKDFTPRERDGTDYIRQQITITEELPPSLDRRRRKKFRIKSILARVVIGELQFIQQRRINRNQRQKRLAVSENGNRELILNNLERNTEERAMRKYRLLAKKGEGTFSEVIKAQNIKTGSLYAIKCMKSSYKSTEQVNNLREIQAIKRLAHHPNIVKLEEVLFDPPSGRLALVFELLEGNLYELMKDRRQHFGEATVKSFMRQIFNSLDHMHGKGVFHRDIKPENILVDKHGKHLKLADFGSCRGINGKPPFTEYISTRWYRPPECLLTCGVYGPEMDVWGAGCILFELTTLYPLFPGSDEADQIHRIHRVLGTPKDGVVAKLRKHASAQANFAFPHQDGIGLAKLLPDAAENCRNLLGQSVAYDASERITSRRAMQHSYFVGDHPLPSAAPKGAIAAKGKIRRQKPLSKITPQAISSSSSFPSDPTKMAESDKASGPVQTETEPEITKPRSMVSILLARNNKKKFIEESKARNNTFHRKGKKNNASLPKKEKITNRTNLPKLKSLVPDNKSGMENSTSKKNIRRQPKKYASIQPLPQNKGSNENPSFKKHTRRQPKRLANIRSSGYGSASVAPISNASATKKTTSKLPSLNENQTHHSHGNSMPKRKLPPLGRGLR